MRLQRTQIGSLFVPLTPGSLFGMARRFVTRLLGIRTDACLWLVTLFWMAASSALAVDYTRDIKPLLKNKCIACHGRVNQESDLRLDAGELILAGGTGGPVVVPGRVAASRLISRVKSTGDDRMPPEGSRLAVDEIQLLSDWIEDGANFPHDEVIAPLPERHWAFQPIADPPLPTVKLLDWPLDELDHFVLARLEQRGWTPNPQAEPHALLRRAYLDLIGIPPDLKEQAAFAAAPSDANFERVVRALLERPGYGERYGRHWLDVVRYADSNGYERDGAKPEVWRYRDYVIRSLNDDKPFDRFALEQLAGDELPDATTESVIATGFNRLGPWDDEPADPETDRFDQLDDIVNTTSQAFLGLTLGCARCHDHKFDPLTQRDYYSMLAAFNPLQRPQNGRTELTRYAAAPALAKQLEERDASVADHRKHIESLHSDFLRSYLSEVENGFDQKTRKAFLAPAPKRSVAQQELVAKHQGELDRQLAVAMPEELREQVGRLEKNIEMLRSSHADVPRGYFLVEPPAPPEPTHLLIRGSPQNPGPVVPPAVPAVLVDEQPPFLSPNEWSSRRRLSLARWIVSKQNPVTPRVIVNRVWQWHFGAGIVRTPNDFGLLGQPPTHPELLDYLSHWFVHEANWSLKALHRKIMSSRTYRMSRKSRDSYAIADPENLLLWRRSYQRLEVEAIRDSMLFVSGRLNREMYGPAMHPFIPRDALLNHADKTTIWPEFDEAAASRRTVYAFIKRSLLVPMLEVLDLCDTTRTAPQRMVTTVPTQALTLYNGQFVNRQAGHFAERLVAEGGDTLDERITYAWRLTFCRTPSSRERVAMAAFFADELESALRGEASSSQAELAALTSLCRVILNLNEFVYPD